jgi:hypothetical protein
MNRFRVPVLAGLVATLALQLPGSAGKDEAKGGLWIDKDKRTITIDAKIAPRKLEHLKEIYPIEVIASWPHPKGKKAHETIVTIDARPSDVHKALVELGLKPGKPVMGESKQPPQGPEVKVYIEVPEAGGTFRKLTIDKTLVDSRTSKPFPKSVQWRFTGSTMVQTDPNKKDLTYGADESGTLMVIFPVSDRTVMQTNLTMEYERFMKLETNKQALPKEGTAVRLVLEVPKGK